MSDNFPKKSFAFIIVYFISFLFPLFILGADFFDIKVFKKIFDYKTINILIHTFTQSFLSVLISLIIAIPIAIYNSRNKNLITKLISSTIFIPFFFPSVSTGIAIAQLLKGTDLNYTLFAIIIAHTFYNSPIIVKYLSESIVNLDRDLIDSAKLEGANNLEILLYIILPQIRDGLLRGIFLAFTYCFTSFAVILSVGNITYSTFEVAIYTSMYGKFDIPEAFFYAILQFLFLSIVNVLFFRKKESIVIKDYNLKTSEKRNIFNFTLVTVIIYLFFEYGIIIYSILNSFINSSTMTIDLSPFFKLFTHQFNKVYPVIISIIDSLLLSFIAAITATTISIFALETRTKFTDYTILLSLGFSTAFIALMFFYINAKFSVSLIFLLIIGLSLLSIPIGYSFMYDNFINFNRNLIDLAKIDGCSTFKILSQIKFPILRNSIISTFCQLFTIIYGEFTFVFSMKLQNLFPLSSVTNYLISSKRLIQESNAFNTINILIIVIMFILSSEKPVKEKTSHKIKYRPKV